MKSVQLPRNYLGALTVCAIQRRVSFLVLVWLSPIWRKDVTVIMMNIIIGVALGGLFFLAVAQDARGNSDIELCACRCSHALGYRIEPGGILESVAGNSRDSDACSFIVVDEHHAGSLNRNCYRLQDCCQARLQICVFKMKQPRLPRMWLFLFLHNCPLIQAVSWFLAVPSAAPLWRLFES
ncbi:MAG: hypothetical protein HY741_13695 [Chloroflexi bacterium]|nr:hypothetical protein [Chloroflexota bacterium]